MKQDQDNITSSEDRERLKNQFLIIEMQRDFLEWIFDTQITWMTQNEALEEFENSLDSSTTK